MEKYMKIFVSWSKNKSRLLAEETKKLIESIFDNSIEFFFSPQMYKGTRVDHEIHMNLLNSDMCIVCITSENFKNPWLLYEAGVVFGANYANTDGGIVVPILFEHIPEWSSWVDKPLNQYVPIQLQSSNGEFTYGKNDFISFIDELSLTVNKEVTDFDKYWKAYEQAIHTILDKEQLIPASCRFLVERILEKDDGNFTIVSPEITNKHIIFHKGFSTTPLIKILLENVIDYQGKRLWFYGRRNKKLLTSENDAFFRFLVEEGLDNGVDFRCLFPYPESNATYKATNKEKERSFHTDLQTSMEKAINLKHKYGLPTEQLFRVYKNRRTSSIIVSDNAVLHRTIICDGEGYPLPYTNSEFEILSVSDNENQMNRGSIIYNQFVEVWDNSIPLTEDLYNEIYCNE